MMPGTSQGRVRFRAEIISDLNGLERTQMHFDSLYSELLVSQRNRGFSGRRRPRRHGSVKPSFPSLKFSRTSLFSSTVFVVGKQFSGIKSRTKNLEIQDDEDCRLRLFISINSASGG